MCLVIIQEGGGSLSLSTEDQHQIAVATQLLKDCDNILVFSGAGLDAGSGLPTFDPRVSDAIVDWGIDRWRNDPEWRQHVWQMYEKYADVKPNAGHDAILSLVNAGLADHVTTNVSGLSHGAVELCGTAMNIYMEETDEGWLVRPDVTFIGEQLPAEPIMEYFDISKQMDGLIIVGASPLIGLWSTALIRAVEEALPVVVINRMPEPLWDENADVIIRADAAQALPLLSRGLLTEYNGRSKQEVNHS